MRHILSKQLAFLGLQGFAIAVKDQGDAEGGGPVAEEIGFRAGGGGGVEEGEGEEEAVGERAGGHFERRWVVVATASAGVLSTDKASSCKPWF